MQYATPKLKFNQYVFGNFWMLFEAKKSGGLGN
jgi:hypothetical protein